MAEPPEESRQFARSVGALADIFAFTCAFYRQAEVTTEDQLAIDFAVEEIFTNIVKYQSASTASVTITLHRTGDQVRVTIVDPDSDRFDPTAAPDAGTDAPLDARTPGGLGIHLTRRLVDRMEYRYAGRTGTITLTKRVSGTP